MKKTFQADLQNLPVIFLWLESFFSKYKLSKSKCKKIELAVEEVFTNIIKHGYKGKKEDIEIQLNPKSTEVDIVIIDNCPPFDPLSHIYSSNIDADIEKRQIGGLGIYLIKKLVDKLTYVRKNDQNILTLSIHFSEEE